MPAGATDAIVDGELHRPGRGVGDREACGLDQRDLERFLGCAGHQRPDAGYVRLGIVAGSLRRAHEGDLRRSERGTRVVEVVDGLDDETSSDPQLAGDRRDRLALGNGPAVDEPPREVGMTNLVGEFPGYGLVWYYKDGIANILSLAQVKRLFRVTYDSWASDSFVVHKPDGSEQLFRECANGLHYYDLEAVESVPPSIPDRSKQVTLAVAIMHVNGIPFLVSLSTKLQFGTSERLSSTDGLTLKTALGRIFKLYEHRSFHVSELRADGEFECLRYELPAGTATNICGADEHVPEIERHIRTIKERCRCIFNTLPFVALPPRLVAEMVAASVFWLNCFPPSQGGSATLSPRQLVLGEHIDYQKHCTLEFGTYVQTHDEHDNSMKSRSTGAIALRPTGNRQGGYFFYSLRTGLRLHRRSGSWDVLPMPQSVVDRVHELAQLAPAGITFDDFPDDPADDDSSDDTSYTPSTADSDVSLNDNYYAPIAGVNDSLGDDDDDGDDGEDQDPPTIEVTEEEEEHPSDEELPDGESTGVHNEDTNEPAGESTGVDEEEPGESTGVNEDPTAGDDGPKNEPATVAVEAEWTLVRRRQSPRKKGQFVQADIAATSTGVCTDTAAAATARELDGNYYAPIADMMDGFDDTELDNESTLRESTGVQNYSSLSELDKTGLDDYNSISYSELDETELDDAELEDDAFTLDAGLNDTGLSDTNSTGGNKIRDNNMGPDAYEPDASNVSVADDTVQRDNPHAKSEDGRITGVTNDNAKGTTIDKKMSANEAEKDEWTLVQRRKWRHKSSQKEVQQPRMQHAQAETKCGKAISATSQQLYGWWSIFGNSEDDDDKESVQLDKDTDNGLHDDKKDGAADISSDESIPELVPRVDDDDSADSESTPGLVPLCAPFTVCRFIYFHNLILHRKENDADVDTPPSSQECVGIGPKVEDTIENTTDKATSVNTSVPEKTS